MTGAPWSGFLKTFLLTLGGLLLLAGGLVFWANPYRNLPLAPADRPMMDINQRFLYPATARDLAFDSAVFGTSSIRLLRPDRLEAALGGTFAQLAMNSATAYEQARLAELFLRVRADAGRTPRTVLLGIDSVWCGEGADFARYTQRAFPEWMYDDDPWNDLAFMLNGKTVEIAGRMVGYSLGLDEPRFEATGYANFLPPATDYDLARAREHIYGSPEPRPVIPQDPPEAIPAAERAAWPFGTHALLRELIAATPAETTLVLAFVPYHAYIQGPPGSRAAAIMDECKRRVVGLAEAHPRALVLDFMMPSPITTRDENYWDPLHYGVETAAEVVDLIGRAVRQGDADPARVDVLYDGLPRPLAPPAI